MSRELAQLVVIGIPLLCLIYVAIQTILLVKLLDALKSITKNTDKKVLEDKPNNQ